MDDITRSDVVRFEHDTVFVLGASNAPGPWPRALHRVRIAIGPIRALAMESFTANSEAEAEALAAAYVEDCRQFWERQNGLRPYSEEK